ncbi:hypothetical protein Y032_0044g1033 [Ancylostoma ceylanicum]|nr:hypothetical protein Y032_0044g1033 [Ancylostoma ceylanicum]
MFIVLLAMALVLYADTHAPTAIIIRAHQFVAPRYVAVGIPSPLVYPTYAAVWPRVISPTYTGVIFQRQEVADFLGIPAVYWVALSLVVVAIIVGGLLFLILFIVRRQQKRSIKRAQQTRSNS